MSKYHDDLGSRIANHPEKYRYIRIDDEEEAHRLALMEKSTREQASMYGDLGLPATKRYLASKALGDTIVLQHLPAEYGGQRAAERVLHGYENHGLYEASRIELDDPDNAAKLRSLEEQQASVREQRRADYIQRLRDSLPELSQGVYEPVFLTAPGSIVKRDEVGRPITAVLQSEGKGVARPSEAAVRTATRTISEALLHKFHGTVGELSVTELPVDQDWFKEYFSADQQEKIIRGTVKRLRFAVVLRPGPSQRISQVETTAYTIEDRGKHLHTKFTNRVADRLTATEYAEQVQRESAERARVLEAQALQHPLSAGLPSLGKQR